MAINFNEIIRTLIEDTAPVSRATVRRLSNLGQPEEKALITAWGRIPVERRHQILQEINGLLDADFEMDFAIVTRIALTDLNDSVREMAVETSWPDETSDMMNRLLPMATIDLSSSVRAAAVGALGRFILQAELGKFSALQARQAQQVALRLFNNANEDLQVRCRALEAISNSSRSEVPTLIQQAYAADDARLRASALYAMGKSCDERWSNTVLRELNSDDPIIRFEAVRAAGELSLEEAVPHLAQMLTDDDRQILEMAVWSLGEIGGGESRRLLNRLVHYAEEIEDEKLLEQVEDAIATASLNSGSLFGL